MPLAPWAQIFTHLVPIGGSVGCWEDSETFRKWPYYRK